MLSLISSSFKFFLFIWHAYEDLLHIGCTPRHSSTNDHVQDHHQAFAQQTLGERLQGPCLSWSIYPAPPISLKCLQTALKFRLHGCKICDVCGYGYILQILLIPLLLTSNQQNIKHIRLRFQQVVNSNLVVNRLADDKSSQGGTLLQLDTLQHLGPVAIGVAIRQGFRAPQFQDFCKRVTNGNARRIQKIFPNVQRHLNMGINTQWKAKQHCECRIFWTEGDIP